VTACAGCHGIDASGGFVGEGVRGKDAGETREYIDDEKAMRFLGGLPRSDTDDIGNYLRGLDDKD
jgi:mono/diheme cytochrome c family protein